MKLALIDLDFLEGVAEMPNPYLMKVSSYYKQKKANVVLLENFKNLHLYDKIIIFKEKNTSFLPSPNILTDEKVELMGQALRRQSNYKPFRVEYAMARPDYLIYKFEIPTELTEASFIQLTYKGEIIGSQNQTKDTKERAVNIIMDDFWHSPNLEQILDMFAVFPKIVFFEKVDFSKLNNPILIEKFLKLRLFKRQIKHKNLSSLKEMEQALISINQMKKMKTTLSIGDIPFIAFDKNSSNDRYLECVSIAAMANRLQVKIKFLVPRTELVPEAKPFLDFVDYENEKNSFAEHLIRKYPRTKENTIRILEEIKNKDEQTFENMLTKWGGYLISQGDL